MANTATEYELLTKAIYQTILKQEGANVEVLHNVSIKGTTGVSHQIDVHWRFKQAGEEHLVVIECKNYGKNVTLGKIRDFRSVLDDIKASRGIMVTKIGYQSGALVYAKKLGIALKTLRPPTEDDLSTLLKKIQIVVTAKFVENSSEKPVKVQVQLQSASPEQKALLEKAGREGLLIIENALDLVFLDRFGKPKTEEMRFWLPQQLDVLEKAEGGPYKQVLASEDNHIILPLYGNDELVQVKSIEAEYFVTSNTDHLVIQADYIVKAILKDVDTEEIVHVENLPGENQKPNEEEAKGRAL